MEITGRVLQVISPETGEGKNGKWQKQTIVIELAGDTKYPKQVALTLWKEQVGKYKEDDTITAQIDIESRQHKGRWYTDIRAWKIEVQQRREQQSVIVQPEETDDLPF